MEKHSLFLFLALISEIIGTVSGFGSSILFVPIASLFFDFKTVLGITAIFHVFSNLSKIFLFKNGIDRNVAFKLGVPAIVFVIVGAWCTTFLHAGPMEAIMSLALIFLSVYLLLNFNRQLKRTNVNLYLGGATSGLLAGLAGTGGAIRGITLAAFHLPKNIFIATSAIIDLGVDASRAIIYISNGYLYCAQWLLIPFLIAVSFIGSYLGMVVLNYTSEKLFRFIVLAVVISVSLFQVVELIW